MSGEMDALADQSWHSKISTSVVTFFERTFFRHGRFVASHPILVMIFATIICLLAAIGFLNLQLESKPEKLWIPQETDYIQTLKWQKANYPNYYRLELLLFVADNVLEPSYIKEMFHLKEKISTMSVMSDSGHNNTQDDMCFRVPALGGNTKKMLEDMKKDFDETKTANDKEFDWSQTVHRDAYCQFFNMMSTSCVYLGLLDIWPRNATIVESLSQDDILNAINTATESAAYGIPLNFTTFLGGVSRNETGHILGAKSSLHIWTMEDNRTDFKDDVSKFSAGLADEVNEVLFKWEGEFTNQVLERAREGLPQGLRAIPLSARSILEVGEETIFGDVKFLIVGFCLLFVYVALMLGKLNMVENRISLMYLGMLSIYLSIGFSYGLCAGAGVIYTPIHNILMLLLMGLGVDDMFVIVDSLENLASSEKDFHTMEMRTKMATVLSRAGVSITVTSLTDFLAFAIGSTTALPALQSFCIYAAVGILSLYLMQISFFFAALTLDQTRMEAKRNGIFWFIKHKDWEPNQCSQTNYSKLFIEKLYAKYLLKIPGKVIVIVMTIILTSCSLWGVTNLRQEFNIIWFIPRSSYVSQFLTNLEVYFPETGNAGSVYIEKIDLPRELTNLKWLTEEMDENQFISVVDSWYQPLIDYTLSDTGVHLNENVTEEFFSEAFGKFLFSPKGIKFQTWLYFDGSLSCTKRAPKIKALKFDYRHRIIQDRDDQIQAMDEMKDLVRNANFSGFSACTSPSYNDWETNKLIVKEVIQNLSLALVAVFIMTTLLLVNLKASFLVLFCVILTLVDVMALMQWWGLTIDTVTCINLVLCVGLSVDYSVHVALHFMKVSGSKDERVTKTLLEVGPPVFNGAFSTFLAILLLCNSDSHVFDSFFKILFGVFIYGLYHGLVFLPVALSIVGPPAYVKRPSQSSKGYITKSEADKGIEMTKYSFSS